MARRRSPGPIGRTRPPLLARLRVGTKLMLLVLLPVCVLLAFTVLAARSELRDASDIERFGAATSLSFATAALADALADERAQAVVRRLRPNVETRAELAAAERRVEEALRKATRRVAGYKGNARVAQPLDTARRQLQPLRAQVAGGTLSIPQAVDAYSRIVEDLLGAVGNLDAKRPTDASGRAADAYVAIVQAAEAAQRERVDVAEMLGTPGRPRAGDPWATVEASELDAFRRAAAGGLIGQLDAVLFRPSSITVQELRDRLSTAPDSGLRQTELERWLSASGHRIQDLRRLERRAGDELAATVADDLAGARANAIRDLVLSLSVVALVTALGLVLWRSITVPLREVSEGARALSSGDLSFEVGYGGHDEIGDVAAAFRDLRVSAERLAAAIRSMNTAISDNRLDHRADVDAFEGTWAQLLAGMNETMAAFAELHSQEASLRRVATLVGRGVTPDEIFRAVVSETCELLGADAVTLMRYEADETTTVLANSDVDKGIPVGTRLKLEGVSLAAVLRRTGRPASLRYEDAAGPLADFVREQGFQSSVGAPILLEGRVWGAMTAAWREEHPIPSGADNRMAQFTELTATAIANADSRSQLRASRARLVASTDEARRRIVRDLHDGAQQRLVHAIITLKLARRELPGADEAVMSLVGEALHHAERANVELRELAHGILPGALARGGLAAGVDELVSRLRLPVSVNVVGDRFPSEIEATAYFIVAEALTNLVKHSRARTAEVTAHVEDGALHLEVRDDGIGGADPRGSGLVGLVDRVEAIGGTVAIRSAPGDGTSVTATLPIPEQQAALRDGSAPNGAEASASNIGERRG